MKKGSWERVSYPSVLQGKEEGDGGHGHCIAVGAMIWNIKCRVKLEECSQTPHFSANWEQL